MTAPQDPIAPPRFRTAAEWLESLGNVPPERIVFDPLPGTAAEDDVERLRGRLDKRLCEFVDGTLVEKTTGLSESEIALRIALMLKAFVDMRKVGKVFGADGMVKLFAGRIRIPDVCYIAQDRLPPRPWPAAPMVVPNLVVEVISPSNTKREMAIKLDEHFRVGVQVVWIVCPKTQTVHVYRDAQTHVELNSADPITAAPAIEGFEARVSEFFED